ncbi:MAG: glycosyltransferase family 2 protein, partial [Candidatus Daviesbacteria bacterium]|nr:glycosyltransferase family 2 protein [Candidatus Daviesbacteria bacterium]
HKIKVLVIDNCSCDESALMVKKNFPQVEILENSQNLGFTGGNNLGLKELKSKYALLLNSDTVVLEGSLDSLMNFMDESDYGVASCKLVDGDGKFQPNAGKLPTFLPMFFWLSGTDDILGKIFPINSYQERKIGYYNKDREVGWVSGTAMMIKDVVLKKIGFLDENIFMYGEDVEYCLRANRAGFKIGWTNQTEIIHLGGKSTNQPKFNQWKGEFKGLLYIYNKYYGFLSAFILRILIYIFIIFRITAFLLLGKSQFSKTYAKILFNL